MTAQYVGVAMAERVEVFILVEVTFNKRGKAVIQCDVNSITASVLHE